VINIMEEQLKNYVMKLYAEAYEKFYYNKQINKQDRMIYFDGQVKLLTTAFKGQLNDETELANIRQRAESNVEEILTFYNE